VIIGMALAAALSMLLLAMVVAWGPHVRTEQCVSLVIKAFEPGRVYGLGKLQDRPGARCLKFELVPVQP
jgi:hypothetical protein